MRRAKGGLGAWVDACPKARQAKHLHRTTTNKAGSAPKQALLLIVVPPFSYPSKPAAHHAAHPPSSLCPPAYSFSPCFLAVAVVCRETAPPTPYSLLAQSGDVRSSVSWQHFLEVSLEEFH